MQCDWVEQIYDNNFETMEYFAMVEFYQKYTLKNIVTLGGSLQCFCKNYQRENGYINSLHYISS